MALLLLASCSREQQPAESTIPAPAPAPAPPAAGRLFVTNEQGGDISVVDVAAAKVIATIPVGKRPRGIRLSPDGSTLFVALSGSPAAGPGVDESKLPPPDKKADGIGVVSVREQKLIRVIRAGSDPEQTAISKDGTRLFVANEDAGELTVVSVEDGHVLATLNESLGETEPDGHNLERDLRRYARRYNEMLTTNEALIRTIIGETRRHPEQARQVMCEAGRSMRERLIGYLRAAQEAGSVRHDVELGPAIDAFTGMLLAGMLRRTGFKKYIDYSGDDYVATVVELFLRGIVAPERTPKRTKER